MNLLNNAYKGKTMRAYDMLNFKQKQMKWNSAVFYYDLSYDYACEHSIQIGFMDKLCCNSPAGKG